jgi:hypothetical protein
LKLTPPIHFNAENEDFGDELFFSAAREFLLSETSTKKWQLEVTVDQHQVNLAQNLKVYLECDMRILAGI